MVKKSTCGMAMSMDDGGRRERVEMIFERFNLFA